jgi:hypothetical protein
VNVSLLDQLNGLEEFKKEHEAMTQKISEQSLLFKRERTRTCSVRKTKKN